MGLLPTNTTLDYCELSTSPYNKEEVNKMLHEWQQFINIEDVSIPKEINCKNLSKCYYFLFR